MANLLWRPHCRRPRCERITHKAKLLDRIQSPDTAQNYPSFFPDKCLPPTIDFVRFPCFYVFPLRPFQLSTCGASLLLQNPAKMPGSPTIFAANIPNITNLRNELGYGDARLPRCVTFYADTRAFRRRFTTSNGVNGVDLYDWKSLAGQAGLDEMTTAFLDNTGNGPLYWPDDESSKDYYNKYQYSKDRDR